MASPRNSSHAGHGKNRSLVVVGESSLDGLMAGLSSTSGLGHNPGFGLESTSEGGEGMGMSVEVGQDAGISRGRWSPRFFGKGKERERDADKELERGRAQAKLSSSSRVGSPVDGRTTPSSVMNGSSGRNSRTKHGSFDFEPSRPMSATSTNHTAVGIRGGRVVGITSPYAAKNRAREANAVADALPIGGNGSSKLERSVSFSDTHIKHKRSHTRDTQGPPLSPRAHLRALAEVEPVPPVPTQPSSLAHTAHARKGSVPPPGSTPAASWGRNTTTQTPTISGGSKRRGGGLGLTHGSFPFEPAVSPSTSPCTSEFGVIRSGDSGYGESSTTSASTTNGILNQRRAKGRSLDLHLGLSWAPTKVKPEAIMSSFSSRGRERREREEEEERRKFEDGVNEVFKDVLGETGYATFRKCKAGFCDSINFLTGFFPDIRRFDSQVIPLDGPGGLKTRVENLLDAAPPPRLHEREKLELLDRFIKVVLHTTDTR